jgi:hypothetical protein
MPDLTAKRTLVKSPPELWEELSEVERLAKHLGAFGEIKITKLEPEHTVAWEGEHASGTVSIEPSGWGTKVTLHAELAEAVGPVTAEPGEPDTAEPEPAPEPEASEPDSSEPEPAQEQEPEAVTEPEAAEPEAVAERVIAEKPRRGFFGWLFRTRTGASELEPVKPEPVKPEPVAVEPEPVAVEPEPVAVEPEPVEPEPVAVEPEPVEPEPVAVEPQPVAVEPAEAEPADVPLDPERARLVLDGTLDALGAAHHRPFSRG